MHVAKTPAVSIAPSTSVPPAMVITAPVAKRRRVETSTPYRPPRAHEDVELRSPSSQEYFTPTSWKSRFEPYPSMGNEHTVRSVVREMHKTRDEQRLSPRAIWPRIVNDVCFRDADHIEYAERYVDEKVGRARKRVKQSVSFMPPVAAPRTRKVATGKPETRVMGTHTDSSSEGSNWVLKGMRTGRSSSKISYRRVEPRGQRRRRSELDLLEVIEERARYV